MSLNPLHVYGNLAFIDQLSNRWLIFGDQFNSLFH